jgi:hypothetical protein
MHVPSNCHGRQRHRWRPALATVLMVTLATLASSAQAVDFDEKLKAPAMKDPAELRSQAQAFSARFAHLRAAAPEQLVKDAALAREHFDLSWKISRAIDERRPLPDLADVGIVAGPEGSIHIDSKAFPQWLPMYERLSSLLPGWDFAMFAPELVRRGFRDTDVTSLKEYLATHDLERAAAQRALPTALAFSKVVAKYDKLKRPVDNGLAMSFFYQQARLKAEASREWTAGLLDALDAQRGRILIEFFSEFETKTSWTPSDPAVAVAELLAIMRLPDFQQRATAEAQGVRP